MADGGPSPAFRCKSDKHSRGGDLTYILKSATVVRQTSGVRQRRLRAAQESFTYHLGVVPYLEERLEFEGLEYRVVANRAGSKRGGSMTRNIRWATTPGEMGGKGGEVVVKPSRMMVVG